MTAQAGRGQEKGLYVYKNRRCPLGAAALPLPWPFGPHATGYKQKKTNKPQWWATSSSFCSTVAAFAYNFFPHSLRRVNITSEFRSTATFTL